MFGGRLSDGETSLYGFESHQLQTTRELLEDDTTRPLLPMWLAITVSAFLVILSGLFAGESSFFSTLNAAVQSHSPCVRCEANCPLYVRRSDSRPLKSGLGGTEGECTDRFPAGVHIHVTCKLHCVMLLQNTGVLTPYLLHPFCPEHTLG